MPARGHGPNNVPRYASRRLAAPPRRRRFWRGLNTAARMPRHPQRQGRLPVL